VFLAGSEPRQGYFIKPPVVLSKSVVVDLTNQLPAPAHVLHLLGASAPQHYPLMVAAVLPCYAGLHSGSRYQRLPQHHLPHAQLELCFRLQICCPVVLLLLLLAQWLAVPEAAAALSGAASAAAAAAGLPDRSEFVLEHFEFTPLAELLAKQQQQQRRQQQQQVGHPQKPEQEEKW
jgi:hypothetical protein